MKYYSAELLQRAVQSIVDQTSPNWRLLLIAEEENSAALQNLLAQELQDPRIEMLKHDHWELACKLNAGMRHVGTDFVGILLGDDMWASDAVAVLTDYIVRFPEVDFFHSSRRFIDAADQPISSVYESRDSFSLQDFVLASPVKHLLCWRRQKGLAVGGLDESVKFFGPDDYDFPWTMAEAGAVFKAIPECLYLHRDHRNHYRLTTHVPRSEQIREIKRMLKKHHVSRSDLRRAVRIAKRTYLRQCLYWTKWDKWLKEKLGHNARLGWREKYR